MKVKWKKLFVLLVMWLATEIFLNFLGLDDIADYGEFVFENHGIEFSKMASLVIS